MVTDESTHCTQASATSCYQVVSTNFTPEEDRRPLILGRTFDEFCVQDFIVCVIAKKTRTDYRSARHLTKYPRGLIYLDNPDSRRGVVCISTIAIVEGKSLGECDAEIHLDRRLLAGCVAG